MAPTPIETKPRYFGTKAAQQTVRKGSTLVSGWCDTCRRTGACEHIQIAADVTPGPRPLPLPPSVLPAVDRALVFGLVIGTSVGFWLGALAYHLFARS